MITNPIFLRIRASLCDESVIGDLDDYAAFITREILIAKERASRKEGAA